MKRLTSSLFPGVDLITEEKNVLQVCEDCLDFIPSLHSYQDVLATGNEEAALKFKGAVIFNSSITTEELREKIASVCKNNKLRLYNGEEYIIVPEASRTWVRNPFAPNLFMTKYRDRDIVIRGKKLQDTVVSMLLEFDDTIVLSKDFVETGFTKGTYGVITRDPNKHKGHFRVLLLSDNVEYRGKPYAELVLKDDLYLYDKVTKKRSWLFPQEMFWNHQIIESGTLQDLKDAMPYYIRNGLNVVSKEEYDSLSESKKLRSVVISENDFEGSKSGVFIIR